MMSFPLPASDAASSLLQKFHALRQLLTVPLPDAGVVTGLLPCLDTFECELLQFCQTPPQSEGLSAAPLSPLPDASAGVRASPAMCSFTAPAVPLNVLSRLNATSESPHHGTMPPVSSSTIVHSPPQTSLPPVLIPFTLPSFFPPSLALLTRVEESDPLTSTGGKQTSPKATRPCSNELLAKRACAAATFDGYPNTPPNTEIDRCFRTSTR
ncbi:hypothetical protein FB451DRAFT_1297670 [Mycena latifolia]|nr:hypothetical protein FB451DRAFT_1297670 [Mycena latifolia]